MALKLSKIKSISNNPWKFILSDENNPYQILDYVDSGCYALNAILCDGDIYGGQPLGKRLILSGESSTAKSYFADYLLKAYLDKFAKDDGVVILFETEGSSIAQTAKDIGIDSDNVIIEPVREVEELHKMIINYCDKIKDDYLKTKERTNVLFVIDSLGMLSSKKELEDKLAGKDKTDMTRAKAIKGMFRAVSLELSLLQTPMIVVNHTYANVGGYGDAQTASGGSGAQYAPDVHLYLTKSQRRVGAIQTGIVIRAKVKKSRWIKENTRIEIGLDFENGLSKYSNMPQFAEMCGMLQIKDKSIVIFNGEEYPILNFEMNFLELFGEENFKLLAKKIKENLSFGASEFDINFMSTDEIIKYGVEYGIIIEKARSIILPDSTKIKKKELREDNSLLPQEVIDQIKERIKENEM